MQLALPKLRASNNLKTFSQQLAACNHDLDLWRDRCGVQRTWVPCSAIHGGNTLDERSRLQPYTAERQVVPQGASTIGNASIQ